MPDRPAETRRAELWLGTLVEISVAELAHDSAEPAIAAAFAAVSRVHRALSLHDPDSELSRLNRRAATAVRRISPDLRAVLTCALDLASALARRCSIRPSAAASPISEFLPPQATAIRGASWRDVELSDRGVRFARPLVLDFSGIAKGYAVDCAIAALKAHGVRAGCVNAGGDLRVFGRVSSRVHVRTGGASRVLMPLVEIADGAVATSAYGGQRRRVNGRWATPLIEPRAGLPVMSTRTVSVIAATCMVADALTKVVALRGSAAAGMLSACNASAMVLSPAGGRWRCTRLPGSIAAAVPSATSP